MNMSAYYKSEDGIEMVVRGFESCSTDKSDFKHRDHLTVAVWYLRNSPLAQAIEKMRASLLRFLDYHSVALEKYNETLTLFWIKMTAKLIEELDPGCSLLETTNAVIEALGESQLVLDYYSKKRLWSEEARKAWLDPDLKPLNS
jgi:hypothetical protein